MGPHDADSQALFPFPGVEVCHHVFSAHQFAHRHAPLEGRMEVNHCRRGRIGWEMREGVTLYLGPGDLSLHRMDQCADSVLRFPLGYYEGLSIILDLDTLADSLPEILAGAGVNPRQLAQRFDGLTAMPASGAIDRIFADLYDLPEPLRLAYCQLKVQELLLFLSRTDPAREKQLDRCRAQQVEVVKAVHQQLTSQLDQRFTIEELARQHLVNTSTLKATFKAVYGQPIAAYMKGYRMKQAARLLRETEESVAAIAGQVGYESQSKFAKAFQEIFQVPPTQYRREMRQNGT